jgi:predicted HNH restriction endonuclease
MKTCTKCLKIKSPSEFYNQSDRKSGTSRCRECLNKYFVERWVKRKLDAIAYKGGSCQVCGYDKYYGALQFHHRDPSKKDVVWTKLRLRSWEKITAELDKCDLLCANCHAEVHQKDL